MKRFALAVLLLTLILGACTPGLSTTETVSATVTIPSPTVIPTLTPIDTTYGGCGYQWAYQNLPELSAQFDAAVKNLIPESTSHATAFGENCIGADGQIIRFLAMETDFYVIVPVQTLDDDQTFGNWVAEVLQVVISLPADMLAGPNSGFVEFRFEKSTSESIGFRVPIQQYKETATGINGEQLFHMFYTQP